MKNRIKNISFHFVIICLVLSIFNSLYAAQFNMSDNELDNAIREFNQKLIEESTNPSVDTGINFISRENNGIKLKNKDTEMSFKYDFTDSCKFYIDNTFATNMNYDKYEEISSYNTLPVIGFVLISSHKGYKISDSMVYALKGILDSAINSGAMNNNIENAENLNAYQIAKKLLENVKGYSTDLFKVNFEVISDDGNEIIVRSSVIVNHDADFSILEGYADKVGENIEGLIPGISTSNKENTLSPEKDKELPKAGIEINNFLILKATLVMAIILLSITIIRMYLKKKVN